MVDRPNEDMKPSRPTASATIEQGLAEWHSQFEAEGSPEPDSRKSAKSRLSDMQLSCRAACLVALSLLAVNSVRPQS